MWSYMISGDSARPMALGGDGYAIPVKDRCIELDKYLWFVLSRSMWNRHQNLFNGNVYYLINYMHKPFNIGFLEYAENIHEVFEMDKILPTPRRKNKGYHESAWDTRDIAYKEAIIIKEIKGGLTTVMREKAEEEFGIDYCTIPTEE